LERGIGVMAHAASVLSILCFLKSMAAGSIAKGLRVSVAVDDHTRVVAMKFAPVFSIKSDVPAAHVRQLDAGPVAASPRAANECLK
jgi:hypothetical protein